MVADGADPAFGGDDSSNCHREDGPKTDADPLEMALLVAAQAGDARTVATVVELLNARRLAGAGVVLLADARRERETVDLGVLDLGTGQKRRT